MNKSRKSRIILKDIKHKKGIYHKEEQAVDMATLILRGISQEEAYNLIKARYK